MAWMIKIVIISVNKCLLFFTPNNPYIIKGLQSIIKKKKWEENKNVSQNFAHLISDVESWQLLQSKRELSLLIDVPGINIDN